MRQPTLGRLTSFFEVRLLSRTDLEDGGRVRRWAVSTVLTRGRRSYIACGLSRCRTRRLISGPGLRAGVASTLTPAGCPSADRARRRCSCFRPRLAILGKQMVEL